MSLLKPRARRPPRPMTPEARRHLIDTFEGVCCAQVERIERVLYRRYSLDYQPRPGFREGPGNRHFVTPQNDDMTRWLMEQETDLEVRR